MERKAHKASTLPKNHRQLSKAGSWKGVLPMEEHTNWLSSTKRSALKINIQVTTYGINRLHLYIFNNNQWKKETMNLKESGEGYMEEFEGRKEKEKIL